MSILRCDGALGSIYLGQRPKPSHRFGGLMLKEVKSLSNYGIHGRCIHQLKKAIVCANENENRNRSSGQFDKKEHGKILFGLFIKHIPNKGQIMKKNPWDGIVDEFNKLTDLECDYKGLYKHLSEVVIENDNDWNEHIIEKYPHMKFCEEEETPYLDLFKMVCGDK